MKCSTFRRRDRGSLLVVAMLLSAIIGISLVSYLNLGRTTLHVANRGFYNNAGINMAETGLEEAMWAINKMRDDLNGTWPDGWNASGSDRMARFPRNPATGAATTMDYGQNTSGFVRVRVQQLGSSSPRLIARATITPPTGAPVEKWIEVTLRKRSKFSNGLVAKESIIFRGNRAEVDSWNSDPDGDGHSTLKYSAGVRKDNGSVGSISVSVDAVLVNHADVWGYVATGGHNPTDGVGSNGSILGADSPAGQRVDPNRVSTDFTADFDIEPAETPTSTLGAITTALNLDSGIYAVSAISLTGNSKIIRVAAGEDVTLVVHGNINIGGNGNGFYIEPAYIHPTNPALNRPAGKLTIYAAGDVDVRGNAVINGGDTKETANPPSAFQLYGTSTTTQSIDIGGTAAFSGAVYAPNATVNIHGNIDAMGSIVAKSIDIKGNCQFHYDEALDNLAGGSPYGITRWRELTTAGERSAYSANLSF